MLAGLALSNLFFLLPMQAQLILPKSGETLPTFEVATIKPAPADAHMTRENWVSEGPQMDNVALGAIIRDAYDAHSKAQLVGGPQALLEQRFDLRTRIDPADIAKLKTISPNERSRRVRLMLQALLRDRFQLKMHVETRELPAYALVVAKGGPKLKPTAPPDSMPASQTQAVTHTPGSPGHPSPRPPKGMHWSMGSSSKWAHMDVSGGTMEELAAALTGREETRGRLVIDRTGLTEKYDWYLAWTPPQAQMESKANDSSHGPDAPGLFTALREQLGLRLESQKGPVQVVVIDHLAPPSPN
jgi:uncharacterized protein (TIGR03435 family)